MSRLFAQLFAAVPAMALFSRRSEPQPSGVSSAAAPAIADVPVRYRPRLVVQLLADHETLRVLMRKLLGVSCDRNDDARIRCLREVASVFRNASLLKATQLYPYLRWGLEKDRFAARQLAAMHAEVLRLSSRIEATFEEYLDGPWLGEQRQRFVDDMVRIAHLVSTSLKHEEAGLFPLYMPPGQYRHVLGARH